MRGLHKSIPRGRRPSLDDGARGIIIASSGGVAPDVRCGYCFPSLNQSNALRTCSTTTGASTSIWTRPLCQCQVSTSILDVGDDFIVPAVVRYLGVRSLVSFGATCKSYRNAAYTEVTRRRRCIASIEDEVTLILNDATMDDDDKFYEAETLVYNTVRLIDDESPQSILKIITYRDYSYDMETSLAYECKLSDCFFREREKIISLTDRRPYYYWSNKEVNLGGYEFCITCGAACSNGECGCGYFCSGCDEYGEGCTCRGWGWDNIGDFCINCGKYDCCSCCGLGCTFRGDPEHRADHLTHLPCCYNDEEYISSGFGPKYSYFGHGPSTLWKGSMRCRARMAKKGITAKSLAGRFKRSGRSPKVRI